METSSREIIRCTRCRLQQYMTQTQRCRRCSGDLLPPPPPPEPTGPETVTASNLMASRLRLVRRCRHFSQPELAERAQVSQQFISVMERGRSRVTLETLERYARALNLPLHVLFAPAPQFERYLQKQGMV
ncbi:helix-turn-helix transcriptional regulator [Terriglobus albidus]|uniref:Helix-turn-helix transcriptional regulator n=1 Tax=Terriglobus albidus TaxID=1592106 RepID=A0A5B9EEZ3_9BACT|nr:helix-turn-helix transcriptional regulator [Terriglobus albidus]QEE30612.1 helix-turn-helix transcriptional regulator [Terriglobus albidus]